MSFEIETPLLRRVCKRIVTPYYLMGFKLNRRNSCTNSLELLVLGKVFKGVTYLERDVQRV